MKCKNCRAEIDDEVIFCPECGTRVERKFDADKTVPLFAAGSAKQSGVPVEFCPNCGAKAEAGAEFCESCGYRLKGAAVVPTPTPGPGPTPASSRAPIPSPVQARVPEAEGQKKNLRLPLVIGGVAAAVVLLAAGLFAVPRAVKAIAGGGGSKTVEEVFYVKDRGLHGASLKNAKKKPVEYTDHFADADSLYDAVSRFYGYQFVSKDGNYHFFMEDVNFDTFTLYSQKGSKDPVKVDSNIHGMYQVTDDNKVVYIKNDNLYVSDLKDKTKIAADVEEFMLDQEGRNVLWMVDSGNEDGGYDMYYQDLAMKKDKNKLISDAFLYKSSSDLNTLLVTKDESLYLVQNQGDVQKLASNAENVLGADLSKGTFFYLGNEEEKVNAMELVDDDMAASDAQITEPVKANYERNEVVGQGYWAYTRTITDDRYYEDLDRYKEKVERDNLRRELSAMEIEVPYQTLYYYSGGEAQLVTDRFVDWYSYPYIIDSDKEINKEFTSYLMYQRANDSLENRVKLSELSYAEELESKIYYERGNDVAACLFAGGVEAELDLDGRIVNGTYKDVKNNQLYCHLVEPDNYGGPGDLVSISLGEGNLGEMESRDSEVYGVELVFDGNVYYMKDVNDREMGDLYCNGERVVTDASRYTTQAVPDSSAILCLADPDRDSGAGSLMYVKGRNAEKIADDVYEYHAFGEDRVVMLANYNYNRYKGELKYYNGKELRDVDSDVRGFFY